MEHLLYFAVGAVCGALLTHYLPRMLRPRKPRAYMTNPSAERRMMDARYPMS